MKPTARVYVAVSAWSGGHSLRLRLHRPARRNQNGSPQSSGNLGLESEQFAPTRRNGHVLATEVAKPMFFVTKMGPISAPYRCGGQLCYEKNIAGRAQSHHAFFLRCDSKCSAPTHSVNRSTLDAQQSNRRRGRLVFAISELLVQPRRFSE